MNMMQRRAFQPMLRSRGQLYKIQTRWMVGSSGPNTCKHVIHDTAQCINIALRCSRVTDTGDNEAEIRGELASWVRYDQTTPFWQNSLEEIGGAVSMYSSTSRPRIETSGSEKVPLQVGQERIRIILVSSWNSQE